jgi:serine/threonine protein kinase
MPDDVEDLGLSRSFRVVDGSLTVEASFEKILKASVASDPSKLSTGLVGTVVDSKYRVLSLLGEGGMGTVYRVLHLNLNKEVALKTFRTANFSQDAWQRFQREAQAIAKLTHPNIIQVFDFGISEQGFPYYTMELLVGESLAERYGREGPLSCDQALPIFIAVAAGMAHAHRQGIVHRDIKPANIFLEQGKGEGIPRMVDFGLAKLATSQGTEEQRLTAAGLVFGSPLYMSPEQSMGLETDQRTDIYSFGCSLFQALTGAPPFSGRTALDTILMHQEKAPPRMVELAKGVTFSQTLEAIMAKLLAKDVKHRYQSFEDVQRDLFEVGPAGSVTSKSVGRVIADTAKLERDGANASGPGAGLEVGNSDLGDQDQNQKAGAVNIGIGITALSVLTGLAVWFFVFKAHQQKLPNDVKAALTAGTAAQPSVGSIKEKEKDKVADQPQYFSSKANGQIIFSFPTTGESFGEICISGQEKNLQSASGRVQFPVGKHLELQAGRAFSNDPKLFRKFGPNDLWHLYLSRGLYWSSKHLAEIERLQGLRILDLGEANLQETDWKNIDKLKNLTWLSVSKTELDAKDVGRLSRIKDLDRLECDELSNIMSLLNQLRNTTSLRFLSLKNCELKDKDLETIGTMSSLQTLIIDSNPKITTEGLKHLQALHQLHRLEMPGATKVGPEAIEVLREFKRLGVLRISTDRWTQAQRENLTISLPKGCIQESAGSRNNLE